MKIMRMEDRLYFVMSNKDLKMIKRSQSPLVLEVGEKEEKKEKLAFCTEECMTRVLRHAQATKQKKAEEQPVEQEQPTEEKATE